MIRSGHYPSQVNLNGLPKIPAILVEKGLGGYLQPAERTIQTKINDQEFSQFIPSNGGHPPAASLQIHQLELHGQPNHFLNALGDLKRPCLCCGSIEVLKDVVADVIPARHQFKLFPGLSA